MSVPSVPFYIRHQMSGLYLTIDSKGNNIKLQTLDHEENQQWTYDTSNAQDNAFKSVSKPGGETVAMDAGSFVAGQNVKARKFEENKSTQQWTPLSTGIIQAQTDNNFSIGIKKTGNGQKGDEAVLVSSTQQPDKYEYVVNP
ncbi:uncharacterized protein LOC144907002 [Branchiostoma floridae x Branchiostoma belcheri]